MAEMFGPQFLAQVTPEEGAEGGDSDAGFPRQKYFIVLLANGLGLNSRYHAAIAPELAGTATVCLTAENRIDTSMALMRCCTIEQLEIGTSNDQTNLEAYGAMMRRIWDLCHEHSIDHLAIIPQKGSFWSSGLMRYSGFHLCDCEMPRRDADNNHSFQLCMTSTPISRKPRSKNLNIEPYVVKKKDKGAVVVNNSQPAGNDADAGGPQPKVEYCMKWLLDHNCAFMRNGCRFSHEMPVDKATRVAIGINNKIPRWFRESEDYIPYLQKMDPSELDEVLSHSKAVAFTPQVSEQLFGRKGKPIDLLGGEEVMTTTLKRAFPTLVPYAVHPPRQQTPTQTDNNKGRDNNGRVKAKKKGRGRFHYDRIVTNLEN